MRRLGTLGMTSLMALVGLLSPAVLNAQGADAGGRGRGSGGAEARLRPPGGNDGWQLGASAELTDTGARIRKVDRESPAERAGLESGDVVVTVDGYQVGRVGGQSYALDAELNRRADNAGRVRLLVLDRRGGQLANVDVRLERGRADREIVVRGRAILPDHARLPRDAELHVRLLRRSILGERVVSETRHSVGGGGPASFEIVCDPRRTELDKEHELDVEIISQGRVIYTQSGRQAVRLDPPPQRIDVRMRKN